MISFYSGVCRMQGTTLCVLTSPHTPIQIDLQLLHMFVFRYFIEGVLLNNTNERIYIDKYLHGESLVFIGVWPMMATIKRPS